MSAFDPSSCDPKLPSEPIFVLSDPTVGPSFSDPAAIKSGATIAVNPLKLEDLEIDDVCRLLARCKVSVDEETVRSQRLTGATLVFSVDCADDLVEVGLKPLPAKMLFRLIGEWKTNGLPADFTINAGHPAADSTVATSAAASVPPVPLDPPVPPVPVIAPTTTPAHTPVHNAVSTPAVRLPDSSDPIVPPSCDPVQADQPNSAQRAEVNNWAYRWYIFDDSDALERLQQACDAGNPLAEIWRGYYYKYHCTMFTSNTTKSEALIKKAWPWVKAEAAKGCKYAQYIAGCCLSEGCVEYGSKAEGHRNYRLAAAQHHPSAAYSLGWVAADKTEAAKYMQMAAELGHAGAQYQVGKGLRDGYSVVKDELKGYQWLKLSADQGHAFAQLTVASCYQFGTGVTKDMTMALHYNKMAADGGNDLAQFRTGEFYEQGKGVAADLAEAKRYYRLAANTHAAARDALQRLG